MNDLISQVKAFYGELTGTQRAVLFAAVTVCVAALVGVWSWSVSDSYSTIYSSADPRQVQATAGSLDEAGIPYRVTGDGSGLEVTYDHLGQARMIAAANGQPSGLDIIREIDLGTSPKEALWQRIYGLQLDLQESINSIDAVQSSRVHLDLSDRPAFLKRDWASSASITVHLHPGAVLADQQVRGIAALVAGAIQGMSLKDIYVLDGQGNLLHPAGDSASGSGTLSNLLEQRRSYEDELFAKVLAALPPALQSPEHIAVAVTVELEETSTERRRDMLDPDNIAPVSVDFRQEDSREEGTAGGVPGAESNLPEQALGSTGGAETSIIEEQTNNAIGQIHEVELTPAGSLRRVSAAVTINESALQAIADASDGAVEVDQLREMMQRSIERALGLDEARGDTLEVNFFPFPAVEKVDMGGGMGTFLHQIRPFASTAVAGLAVVLFFFLVMRPIVSKITSITIPEPRQLADDAAASAHRDNPDEMISRMRGLVDNFEKIDARDLNKLAQMHDEPAAQVLRRWLKAS